MTMTWWLRACACAVVAVAMLGLSERVARADSIRSDLTIDDFGGPKDDVESFSAPSAYTSSHDWGLGLSYSNLDGASDWVNTYGGYGLGYEGVVTTGRGGVDGYFGTGPVQTSFELVFALGTSKFGFYGAEAVVDGGLDGRDGILHLELYGLDDQLLGELEIVTAGTPAWEGFHGLASEELIGRIVFRDVGHMVLDDLQFDVQHAPEPASLALLGLGVAGLAGARRRRRRSG